MMDLYSIGEMVIDMIPGSEPASYLRRAGGGSCQCSHCSCEKRIKGVSYLQGGK